MATQTIMQSVVAASSVSDATPVKMLDVRIEFTGGLEMLFSNKKKHEIQMPATNSEADSPSTIADLINFLCDNLMDDPRKDLFVLEDTVRPGILVLINDADWELEGEANYKLEDGDEIVFVSTLHGG